MTMDNIGLFQGLSAKMDYLHKRQSVIAQNVANADTPNYIPKDLKEVDFGSVLQASQGKRQVQPVRLNGTSGDHFSARSQVDSSYSETKQDHVYEVSPSGNAVIMEEQMMNAAKNTMDYNLMTTVYQKNVGMIRMAIGQSR